VSALDPQAAQLLARVARAALPPYWEVPPHLARRLYRETRAALAPPAPEVARVRLHVVHGRFALRGYWPALAAPEARLPALVYYHGGGWVIGDLDTHDVLCRELANAVRCAVFAVDYRLAPEHPFPAAVEDACDALAWVAENADALGVDAARLAVGGDSAGGNLAAVAALAARDAGRPKLAAQLLVYPATDQHGGFPSHERNAEGYLLTRQAIEYFRGHYLPDARLWGDWRASPLRAPDHRAVAPAFVLTAGFDPLRDEGLAYAERLAEAGVEVSYREYPDMIHGFLLFGGVLARAREALVECAAWLAARLAAR